MTMLDTANPRAVVGGNNPPLAEALADGYRALAAEIDDVVAAAAELAEVTSDELDRTATSIAIDLAALRGKVEDGQEAENRPHLDASRTIREFFKPLAERIDAEIARLRAKVAVHKRRVAEALAARQRKIAEESAAEAARIRRELDEQRQSEPAAVSEVQTVIARGLERRAEDATAEAAAPIAAKTKVRTATGATSTAHTVWAFRVEDRAKIPLDRLRPYLSDEAVDRAIRAFVDANGRELPGVAIFEDTAVHFRSGRRR